jgi:hypothetical protein
MTSLINADTSGGLTLTSDTSGALDIQSAGTTKIAMDSSGNVDIVGTVTGAAFEPDGDTAAGDNAAIGYTAVEGLILTGQGSTSDITFKNDADATVMSIPTGTTNVAVTGSVGLDNAKYLSFENAAGTFTAGSAGASFLKYSDNNLYVDNFEGDRVYRRASSAETMRIDSSGNLLLATTNTSGTAGVGIKFNASSATVPDTFTVFNTAVAAATYHLYNTNVTNNGYRFYVHVNGGVYNFSSNNSNLSDIRVKTNIELSGDYLSKICAIPVKLFNYKDEPADKPRNLGVIAQDVEAVAPELVNTGGFGETPEDGIPLKSIYTTDMQYALMKAIQEQQVIIEALTARITALEG